MNKLKVELFDAVTGEKQHEVESNNYVAPAIQHALKSASRNILFSAKILTNNISGYADTALSSMFDYLNLSTDTSAIDVNKNLIIDQTIIGYATRKATYAGTEENRGTINIAESKGNYLKQEYVFDFATDKANGTFRSLLFSPQNTANNSQVHSYSYFLKEQSLLAINQTEYERGPICVDSSYIYKIQNSEIRRYNKTTYLYVDSITMTGLPVSITSVTSIATDGTHIYFCFNSFVYKVLLSGTYVNRLSLSSCVGLAVIGASLYATRQNDANMYIINSSTMLQTGTRQFKRYGAILSMGSAYLISFDASLYLIDLNERCLNNVDYSGATDAIVFPIGRVLNLFKQPAMITATDMIMPYITQINDTYTSFTSFPAAAYHYTKIDITSACNIGSRILLPSPVTKTNQQTMKITYTINLTD